MVYDRVMTTSHPRSDLPIILLAAGQSSRMRGRDKLLEKIDGVTLLGLQVRRARACVERGQRRADFERVGVVRARIANQTNTPPVGPRRCGNRFPCRSPMDPRHDEGNAKRACLFNAVRGIHVD